MDTKKYVCTRCNQEFPTKWNMERHINANTCAPIKIKPANNLIGLNPALQAHIAKFIVVWQEEIFKFEKTDTY